MKEFRAYRPFSWPGDPFRVDFVRRDSCLGEIVQQVINQHLQGFHGQERQENAAADHTEHVTEVGTGCHPDVLDDVSEYLAAFNYAFLQHQQAGPVELHLLLMMVS